MVKIKYKDLINAIRYIEKNCKEEPIKISIDSTVLKLECSDLTVQVYDKDYYFVPNIIKKTRLEDQDD